MMDFKKWMMENGTSKGLGGGLVPPQESPHLYATAMHDYHDKNSANADNQNGMLPPIKKPKKIENNGKRRK
jgi:hypothetical protein